jgi:hypothetical protein
MLHKINYLPITRSIPGVFILPEGTNLHNIVLVCLILYFMPGLCLDFATTRPLATIKHEERL